MSTESNLVAVRDFNDAGTGRAFEKGQTPDVDAGTMANYEAAGLVAPPTNDPIEAATDAVAEPDGAASADEQPAVEPTPKPRKAR